MHLGFVIAGLPYSFQGQMGHAEVMANSRTGRRRLRVATAAASPRSSISKARRFQGKHIGRSHRRSAHKGAREEIKMLNQSDNELICRAGPGRRWAA